jgi:phospholipase/carboxylesterase
MSTEIELAAWPHVYRLGSGPVLLMLHGTGSSELDILKLADEIDAAAAVIAPRGQVTERGALRWFRRLSEGVFDVDDAIRRASDLAQFVGWAVSRYDLHDRQIVATGFSNGANIALATGILFPTLFDTTIAFSGMYPFAALGIPQDLSIRSGLSFRRFVLLNGDCDAMAPTASVDRLVAELTHAGADVTRHTRTGGHAITTDELQIARAALRPAAAHA